MSAQTNLKVEPTSKRKMSDAKQKTEKKKYLRNVVKGIGDLLDEENETASVKEGHQNVLNLVEVLMRELQKLKNTVKEQTQQQTLLAGYISSITTIHHNQIDSLCSELAKEQQSNQLLRTSVASILQQYEKKKIFNQSTPQAIFSSTQIEGLLKILETTQTSTMDVQAEFKEIPSFSEWANEHKALINKQQQKNEEMEADLASELAKKLAQETNMEEEEPKEATEFINDECALEHVTIDNTGIMPIEPRVSGFRIENGSLCYMDPDAEEEEVFNGLVDSHKDIPYYQSFYYGKPHTNYIVEDIEKGIFFISIIGENVVKEIKKFGTIVRHEGGIVVCPRSRKKKLIQTFGLNPNSPWKEIKDVAFSDALRDLEAKDLRVRHRNKFAMLYVKEGQNQNEMFSNTEGSEDWDEFVEFMGDKIELQGWTKYNGGLDTESGTTGTHSVYLQHAGVEIMFHVSTMIPVSDSDEQQVERKRHLGNDVVVLIFKEGNVPFSPTVIRSHFNSIFIVVQKYNNLDDPENTYYQLSVASREGVDPFPPFLPQSPVFKKNRALRNFIICKMINGERKAYLTNEFSTRLARARTGVMKAISKDFLKK